MISQNFDVPGGVVNGCSGTLKSVRSRLDEKGRRHAISCVIEAPDTTPGIIEGLSDHHVGFGSFRTLCIRDSATYGGLNLASQNWINFAGEPHPTLQTIFLELSLQQSGTV